jgi:DNA-binding NarL/FixJ family response regulator
VRDQAELPQRILSTVLIVEDHDMLRAKLYDWLSAVFAEYWFLLASNGEQALALVTVQEPALVLMDIALPTMDGIETTRRVKALVPHTQVIILSMHEDYCYKVEAAAAGASAYICKRTISNDLLPTIGQLLNQAHSAATKAR